LEQRRSQILDYGIVPGGKSARDYLLILLLLVAALVGIAVVSFKPLPPSAPPVTAPTGGGASR
jgi:hypothetical protein